MSYLKAGDTISGQEAVAKMTVYDPDTGVSTIEDLFMAKSLEATVEVEKTDVYTLGHHGAQHKPNGWTGSGTMTIYYITTMFRKMILNYVKKGIPVYFDLLVTNNDPASTVGQQTTTLKRCSLDSVVVAKFDVEEELLDEDVSFTFDDIDVLEEFVAPVLGS